MALGKRKKRAASTGPEKPEILEPEFWRKKTLEEMSEAEWEALCDGCGKCCLLKLEDEDTLKVTYTSIACRLFDDQTCRCGNYALRNTLVPQCVALTPETVRAEKDWMPRSCAYRLLAEGYDLYAWHPLVSGDPESAHKAGVSVQGRTIPEYEVDLEDAPNFAIEETI